MGITTEKYFEHIYNILFEPEEFFENKEHQISVRLAIGTTAVIAGIYKLSGDIFAGKIESFTYLFSLLLYTAGILIVWFLTALLFEYVSKIFDSNGKLKEILFYTAFASVPYLLFPPLNLLKNSSEAGYFAATIIQVALYARIIYLYAYSLKTAYGLTLSKSFMFLFLPFVSLFFFLYWSICIFSKIWYIFTL